jgi:hypothetical protein
MKKLKMWVAVDVNGDAFGYEFKPRLGEMRCAFICDRGFMVYLGTLDSHAGQCWRHEITVPPVTKKRRANK